MTNTLILIPDKNLQSGMYHLAKDMKGDIEVLRFSNPIYRLFPLLDLLRGFNFRQYSRVITFIYPMPKNRA